MTRKLRRNELINEMEATGIMMKSAYRKSEVEQGYRDFQKMLVSKVFDEKHGEELRIREVATHLENLANEYGVEECEEVKDFLEQAEKFEALIAKEISGNNGERIVTRNLKMVKKENITLSNVELAEDDIHTECDKIVITDKAIFLLEVKTAKHNMIITEEGNYMREDGYIHENIGEKFNEKEYLLRQAIKEWADKNGKPINIVKMVVFANNYYKLRDDYKYFKSCYCSALPYIIDEYEGESFYTQEDMQNIKHHIEEAKKTKEYILEFDFSEFRYIFADVMAMLEEQVERREHQEEDLKEKHTDSKPSVNWEKILGIGVAVASVSFMFVSKGLKIVK